MRKPAPNQIAMSVDCGIETLAAMKSKSITCGLAPPMSMPAAMMRTSPIRYMRALIIIAADVLKSEK